MAPDPGAEPGAETGAEAAANAAADEAPADGAAKAKPGKQRKRSFWRDLLVIVVAALVLTIVLKAFVVQVFSIPSGSMENTLIPGDRILVSKIVYDFRSIQRGDIVVFSGDGSWNPEPPAPSNVVLRIWDDAASLV